jgi:DNA polymerase-3 subunit epsilon
MLHGGSVRLRLLLSFVAVGLGAAGCVVGGLWIAAGRLPPGAQTEPLVIAAVISALGTLAVAAFVWLRLDETMARPLEALSAELRTRAHGEVTAPLDQTGARHLGDLGPAAAALCERLVRARGEADAIVAEATARLSAERAQLSGILSEIPLAIVAVGPDQRIMLYDRQTVDLLGPVAPLGLGRPVTDYLAPASLARAVEALAGGSAFVDAELDTADGLRRLKARLRPIGRDGGTLLALETEEEALSERPLVFDFDLLRREPGGELSEKPLSRLSCVVFDTETTGLSVTADEIVQVGAVRVLNGRVVQGEFIDMLVDPGRRIPPVSTRVHGIGDAAVAGAPCPVEAVRVFHRFAEGSVLVAHNAPFDMAFLRRHEAAAGLRFDHPVLDTVLLSAAVYGQGVPHTLDAIASRLGVVLDPAVRHTALGDATATAEVLLRLFPVLEAAGVRTFGEAVTAMRRHQKLLPDLNA